MVRVFSLVMMILLLTACALMPPDCNDNEQLMANQLLYFGREKPGGVVSKKEWKRFLSEVVTPRFPNGLTVWKSSGQWQSSTGDIVREKSYVLSLLYIENAQDNKAVNDIVSEYKARFQQEAVMRVRDSSCVSF